MRLLLGYDGSTGAEVARDLVDHLRLPAGTRLTVATVVSARREILGGADQPAAHEAAHAVEGELLRTVEQHLWRVASSLQGPNHSCECRVLPGRAGRALVDEADRSAAELVVVGSRGHGPFETMLLGSVSAEVVDHAHCPVLVARRPTLHRMILGVDGSASALRAIDALAAWELLRAVPVTVVGVVERVPDWPAVVGGAFAPSVADIGDVLDERRSRLQKSVDQAVATLTRAGMFARGKVCEGDPASSLIDAARAEDADLIVVGTRGLGPLGRLILGSVARTVLLHTDVSVLVVRPPVSRAKVEERVGRLVTAQ